MNQSYHGSCQCGAVSFTLRLPNHLEQYSPRACDCDFCTERSISYLSDPDGTLTIRCTQPLIRLKQGSNQAEFLTCSGCQQVVAATINLIDEAKGAVNVNLLAEQDLLQPAEPISPKQLNPQEKLLRWQQLWLTLTIQQT
jgi:hypothetical protein